MTTSDKARRRVLIVDDERNILSSLSGLLRDEGYDTREASNGEEALERLRSEPFDLALLDVRLPDHDGLTVLERARVLRPDLPIVMMSGHASIDLAVRAVKIGAYDFLEKPLHPLDRVLVIVRNALERARLVAENRRLREDRPDPAIVGDSPRVRALRETIAQVAPTRGRVLIIGESGTGKELVAKALHDGSPRADAPFVKMNCAAIPHELIESTLFGHEKGSFTGATAMATGKFEQAHGGTLLLDEVGDMSLETQAKLLRVLEAGEIERVGGRKTIPVDVRVISATNKNPRDEVAAGRFREDLFFRLAVVPIEVPPLRERDDDVLLIANHFLQCFAAEYGHAVRRFSAEARAVVRRHSWPGNVRELRNAMERAVILDAGGAEISESEARRLIDLAPGGGAALRAGEAGGGAYTAHGACGGAHTAHGGGAGAAGTAASNAPPPSHAGASAGGAQGAANRRSLSGALDQLERDLIESALARHGGNVAEAARELEIDRANLHRKMRRLGITRAKGGAPDGTE